MRFFFLGPRVLGVRPGISVSPRDFQKLAFPSGSMSHTANISGGFVYVLRDESGRHKIGSSIDPIQRIAQLQTGSAERLDFAYIGCAQEGAYTRIENYAHDLLKFQKIPGAGDEWFAVPASIAIGAVIEASSRLGDPIQQIQPAMVPKILAIAAQEAKQEAMPGKHCGIMNPFPWYIRWPVITIVGIVGGLFLAVVFSILMALTQGGGN